MWCYREKVSQHLLFILLYLVCLDFLSFESQFRKLYDLCNYSFFWKFQMHLHRVEESSVLISFIPWFPPLYALLGRALLSFLLIRLLTYLCIFLKVSSWIYSNIFLFKLIYLFLLLKPSCCFPKHCLIIL